MLISCGQKAYKMNHMLKYKYNKIFKPNILLFYLILVSLEVRFYKITLSANLLN